MPDKATLSSFALTAIIVLAAIVLRSTFLMVQTRTHIIGFIIVAACCELVIRPKLLHQRPSLAWFAINVAFAVAAILMTRWHIEGLCPGLHQAKCVPRL